MRTAWLLLALAPLSCGGSDPTVFGAVLPSGSVPASSVASTSSASSGSGAGGAGGQGGGATASTAASGGAGGMGGQGGDPGQGGGGPDLCEPGPDPCDGMPDGACGEWVDSCGNAIVCGAADACDSPMLHCNESACRCQDATGYALAVNTCAALGGGTPSFCSDDGLRSDVPPGCVDTGVQAPGGNVIWCCD